MKHPRAFTHRLVPGSVSWWLPALLLSGVVLLAILPVQTALGSSRKTPLAYVTQRQADAVAVIDTTINEIVATVEVGPGPGGMDISRDGRHGYVANYGTFPDKFANATSLSDTVSVLKLPRKTSYYHRAGRLPDVVATVTVGSGPLGVAITPNGKEVYVTNFGSDPDVVGLDGVPGNTVSVIKARKNKVIATITVGSLPAGVAISPDGRHAYVANRGDDTVSVINTATHSVVATIVVGDRPANVAFTPDGLRAYITNFSSNSVSVIDTETKTVVATVAVGLVPIGLRVTPDGTRVYVVNVFSNNVSVIDTATNTVVATVEVGPGPPACPPPAPGPPGPGCPGPRAVAITPDGAHAYVTNFLVDTVAVIETATNTVVDTVRVAGGPNWVTIPGKPKKHHGNHHHKGYHDRGYYDWGYHDWGHHDEDDHDNEHWDDD